MLLTKVQGIQYILNNTKSTFIPIIMAITFTFLCISRNKAPPSGWIRWVRNPSNLEPTQKKFNMQALNLLSKSLDNFPPKEVWDPSTKNQNGASVIRLVLMEQFLEFRYQKYLGVFILLIDQSQLHKQPTVTFIQLYIKNGQ